MSASGDQGIKFRDKGPDPLIPDQKTNQGITLLEHELDPLILIPGGGER